MTPTTSREGAEPPPSHSHEGAASGRTVEALGLCEATATCRRLGHTLTRSTLPRSPTDPSLGEEICLSCTGVAGRLEGLRLWQSVCPCCFSSAFPEGLPTLESMPERTIGKAPKGTRASPPATDRSGNGERDDG